MLHREMGILLRKVKLMMNLMDVVFTYGVGFIFLFGIVFLLYLLS